MIAYYELIHMNQTEYFSGQKTLSKDHKSHRDMLSSMVFIKYQILKLLQCKFQIKTQDAEIKELKTQRERIKENYEPSLRQVIYINYIMCLNNINRIVC